MDALNEAKREALAEYAHNAWSGWMKYLFEKSSMKVNDLGDQDGRVVIPAWAVIRWRRQMNTPYADLSEEERESDRKEADEMLAIINGFDATNQYAWAMPTGGVMQRCKHLNGEFMELQEDVHIRMVQDGKLQEEGINEYGLISGYGYRCFDCKKSWYFSGLSKWPKWFQRMRDQL